MKKPIVFCLLFLCTISAMVFGQDVVGYWNTINEKTGKAESIVAIYEYQGKYYGRIIATFDDSGKIQETIYDPKERAPGIVGEPYYSGMDIIWDMQPSGKEYKHGHIVDPEHGKVYDAQMWIQNGNLMVRGEILFFGRNQEWLATQESQFPPNFKKPDFKTFTPKIPEVKDES